MLQLALKRKRRCNATEKVAGGGRPDSLRNDASDKIRRRSRWFVIGCEWS